MSHRFMTLKHAPSTTYYPSQAATTSSTLVSSSTSSGASDFADGDSDAIIYAVLLTGSANTTYRLEDGGGDDLLWTVHTIASGVGKNFGPRGLRMSGGFRIYLASASAGSITVVYDKVAAL
jgi:hypothetical protein